MGPWCAPVEQGPKFAGDDREVYYVAISRTRQEARIYTDDRARLPASMAREHAKHAALDLERR